VQRSSRDESRCGFQFFDVLLYVLGQVRGLVLRENAQQRTQLQPPIVHWYTVSNGKPSQKCKQKEDYVQSRQLRARLSDWGLTALSAQIGYIVPLKHMLQLKK